MRKCAALVYKEKRKAGVSQRVHLLPSSKQHGKWETETVHKHHSRKRKGRGDDFSYSANYQLWTSILPVLGLGRYATGIGTNWTPHVSVFLSASSLIGWDISRELGDFLFWNRLLMTRELWLLYCMSCFLQTRSPSWCLARWSDDATRQKLHLKKRDRDVCLYPFFNAKDLEQSRGLFCFLLSTTSCEN